MSSLFSGLNTAKSGLIESQTAINLVAHNMSNENTEGYTRQTLSLSTVQANSGNYRQPSGGTLVGNGVTDSGVQQSRNPFLDARYRDANAVYSNYDQQYSDYTQIEDIFNEFTGNSATDQKAAGISGQVTDLEADLKKYASSSDTSALSSTVKTDVTSICYTIKNAYESLSALQQQDTSDLNTLVTGSATGSTATDGGVNAMLKDISELNNQIVSYELSGQKANDLRDQRNLLLDKLSGYMDITVTENTSGAVSVKLSTTPQTGTYLIDANNNVNRLQVGTDASGNTVVQFAGTGETAPITGGSVNAYLQVLNGDGSGSGAYGQVGIKSLMAKLNNFALTFKDIMNNTATVGGKTSGGSYGGQDLVSGTSAADIAVSSAWSTDTSLFDKNYTAFLKYAAANPSDTSVSTSTSVGEYAAQFVANLTDTSLSALHTSGMISDAVYTKTAAGIQSGSFLDYSDSFMSEIANTAGSVKNKVDSSETVVTDLDTRRQSISSVSQDEESINMIKFQQAYNASAKVISVIDQMLDKLINGTGLTT